MPLTRETLVYTTLNLFRDLELWKTQPVSLQRMGKAPTNECPDMTQNNLRVRFQQCSNFEECGVLLPCYHSQFHSGRGNDGNERVFCIPLSFSITGASPSVCLVSYQNIGWEEEVTSRQNCCSYILLPQPNGLFTFWVSLRKRLTNCSTGTHRKLS